MNTAQHHPRPEALLRLPQVLSLVPVSKSTWWAGVRDGRFPKPVKLSERVTCWRASDVLAFIEHAGSTDGEAPEKSHE